MGIKTDKSPSHRPLAPYMKEFSRAMRKNPTQAENKLWQKLRGKKLGFGFRRQFVIDSKYIADFVCLEKRLIIECDGGEHNQNFNDIQRDFYLESQNFRILRFWNNEILGNLEGVLYVIKEVLESNADFANAKYTCESTHPLAPSAREGEIKISPRVRNMESLDSYNVGLVCDRGCKLQAIDNIFVANNIIDLHLVGSGSYIFPLYLVESDSSCHSEGAKRPKNLKQNRDSSLNATHFAQNDKADSFNDKEPHPKSLGYGEGLSHSPSTRGDSIHSPSRSTSGARGWVENLTPQFRAFIDTKYGQRFAPEVILGYIYAVLFHKDYREKFLDFLKIDFPRIPFVKSKEQFLALSALGGQIIELHLMRGTLQSITEPLFSNPQNRNERIEKIAYNAEQKRLYVNESLYFSNVSEEVWGYKIGGYAVCEKYLKSHKGEVLDYAHFERIITTLHKSLKVESQIVKIALE